jgi:type II secretory pathway pseudopilin PulG
MSRDPRSTVDAAEGVGPGIGPRRRRGITLTEILIAIMILGVGLVSLATLFPIGLLRLRDATRYTRSAILLQTAAADATSRGLFSSQSFFYSDLLNGNNFPHWYFSRTSGQYNPLIQDTPTYGGDWSTGAYTGFGGLGNNPGQLNQASPLINGYTFPIVGPGLPFAYDPLWRFYVYNPNTNAQGYYLDPANHTTFEARFGYGIPFVRRADPSGGLPSAHGLQRLTNFNGQLVNGFPLMPTSAFVPSIFVSQEDVVWQDPNVGTYTLNGISAANGGVAVQTPSAVIPDLSAPVNAGPGANGGTPSLDWRYSWMYTGQLNSAENLSCFDGSIVIFENRPFGIATPTNMVHSQGGTNDYQVDGETVVEAIFGFSGNVLPNGGPGYGAGADRTVLLRWPSSMPDPVVRPGDWIADVTYERHLGVVALRWWGGTTMTTPGKVAQPVPGGVANPTNNGEWDNLPAQRCFWYQVQKVVPPSLDTLGDVRDYRSMVVYVNQSLQARTLLSGTGGTPAHVNAALIAPNVVNVIPQTIFIR